MSICICFESYFRQQPYKKTFKTDNYLEWTVEENWSVTPHVIQKITLVNDDDYFESYYYVDLEIDSMFQEQDVKILKSERMASNNIKFIIKGHEFETYFGIVDVNSENYIRDHTYRYKITLIPILSFCEETFRKPGKRTKIDLLGGLQILSNDIGSMKDQLFSDTAIYCGNERVKAHRNILSARSTVFKKFLQGVEDEEVQSCLEIEPVSDKKDDKLLNDNMDGIVLKVRLKKVHCSIFREFIDFIYSGQYKTSATTETSAITETSDIIKKTKDLLLAARDYGICDLQHKCIMYLRSQISIHTIDDFYSFASVYKFEDLQIYVLDYLKKKIVGKRRRNVHLMLMIEQGNDDIEDEEGMTTYEKIEWLKTMRNHPTYFKDILKLKKGKKIREVFSRVFPETSFDDDDVMADCRERLEHIIVSVVCAADLGIVDD